MQTDDPEGQELSSEITTSTSGRYFQEAHPLLNLQSVFSIAPRFQDYSYPAWSNTADYTAGKIVSKNSKNWICILTYTISGVGAQDPETVDSDYWEEWTLSDARSQWLKRKTEGYILSVIDDFIDTKKWTRTAKSLIEERALFDGAASAENFTAKSGKVVGMEFRVNRHNSINAKVLSIGLHFTEAGTFDLKLYHSSQVDPIETQSVTITTANTSQITSVNWELPYIATYDVGGTYRIEYTQSEAPGNSINKAIDWSPNPVIERSSRFNSWKLWSPYLDVHPYQVAEADAADPTKRQYIYTDNFGLNPVISVYCDYTGLITRQKSIFTNAIIKGVGCKFLREIAINGNARINQRESSANLRMDEILYEIDGNPQGRATGLGKEYDMALKSIIVDTEGLDKECLPCRKNRARLRTI